MLSGVYSQTPVSPTAPIDKKEIVDAPDTVAFLIRQNETARDLIEAQEKRVADLEAELMLEKENSASIAKSYEAAKSEISSLKTSNEALARAVAINENTIAILQTDNAKQRDKAKKAVRDKWKAILVAAGLFALKVAF